MENKVIETGSSVIRMGEDGIIHIEYLPGAELALENVKEEEAAAAKLANGKRFPILVDSRNLRSLSKEGRAYIEGEGGAKVSIATAVLITTPIGRIIGNFFMSINRPIYPVKLFTSEDEAIEWLRRYLK